MPFYQRKKELSKSLASHFGHSEITGDSIFAEFSTPPKVELGHVALPCFRLAKLLKRKPHELANELAESFGQSDLKITPTGPYANFKWNAGSLFSATVKQVFLEKENYGGDHSGQDKSIVIEYCSPNIAKKLAFHHIRSTLIGNTLSNIYNHLGYKVERINFVGDWGSQFARLLAAVELWGDPNKLSVENMNDSMETLQKVYVKFHKELEADETLLEVASKALQRLENNEAKATELWERIKSISLACMQSTLDRMNAGFDHVEGESTYVPGLVETLEEIKKTSQARQSEGAWVVDVEGEEIPALIQKSDGTTLYLTRDIAAAIDRFNRFKFSKSLYVVAHQQSLHFKLLFGVLKKMGYEWADNCEHLSFGTVRFGATKMSTREGKVIFLEDTLNEAKALALKECTAKNPDLPNKEEVAEKVGIGAVIFGELSSSRNRDIDFSWEHILAFDGETGPYVQYSMVRCISLLSKMKVDVSFDPAAVDNVEASLISQEEEVLILTLSKMRSVLQDAINENEPFYLSRYLIDVAKAFNKFYYQVPILQATDETQRKMRVQLVKATEIVIGNGFKLLGIECPDQM